MALSKSRSEPDRASMRRTRQTYPRRMSNLKKLTLDGITKGVEQYVSKDIEKLIERMPRIVRAVVKAKRGFFYEKKV